MGIRFSHLTSATVAFAASALVAAPAGLAQETEHRSTTSIPEALNEVFFGYGGTHFDNRTIGRQFTFIFGPGGWDSARFPEREIEWDGDAVHRTYQSLLTLQTTLDPTIRVPDLPSPFSTTLMLLPSYQSSGPVVGSEFIYETMPLP